MNMLGKAVIIVILIASIGFMFIGINVYSTHHNWYEKSKTLEQQVASVRLQRDQMEDKFNRLENKNQGEQQAAKNQIAKLETERGRLVVQKDELLSNKETLEKENRSLVAAITTLGTNNKALTDEVATVRTEVRDSQERRDLAVRDALTSTEALHNTKANLETATAQGLQLAKRIAVITSAMVEHGLNPAIEAGTIQPRIDGLVSRIQRSTTAQLIEVTIGSDDGLQTGQTIEVYRGAKYLGRAEIVRTAPDKAVAKIIRRFQKGQIQKGDHVATRLKLS